MARAAKATKTTKPTVPGRQPGRPATAAAKSPVKIGKAAARTQTPAAAPVVPKLNKDELRAQVEKLETTVATLRAKSREANRAAKMAAVRIAELEDQVAQLEKRAASKPPAAKPASKPANSVRSKRASRDVDPGDAVPPGIAVQEPAPLDEETETARTNLETHLAEE